MEPSAPSDQVAGAWLARETAHTRRRWRLVVGLAALALVLVGCSAGVDGAEENAAADNPSEATSVELENIAGSPKLPVPSALEDPTNSSFPKPLIKPSSLRSGGPPPDGIPAIDNPKFQRADSVDWLDPDESVLSFTSSGETRAYPIQIMVWHEIVNDTVAGTPVAVTYCPLCNSAVALDRRVADLVVTFGTSGMLHKSDLVMYDRQTESLWPQLSFSAAIGHLAGTKLKVLPISTVTWGEFKAAHPDAWVLNRDTGVDRDYGRNPYSGYDATDAEDPFLFDGDADGRMAAKTHVIGLFGDADPLAITVAHVLKEGLVNVSGPDGPVLVWARPGVRSPLDADNVADGRETGAAVAFRPRTDKGVGVELVKDAPGKFQDVKTGSTFGPDGVAVAGTLEGQQLIQVPAVDTFWFAWAAFSPDTRVCAEQKCG